MSGFVPGVEYKAYLAERSTRLAAQHKEVRQSLIYKGVLRPLFLPEAQEQALALLEQLLTEAAAEPVDLNAVADAVEDLAGLLINKGAPLAGAGGIGGAEPPMSTLEPTRAPS